MADNRYYYFKDARGNRHTVDKTAYDKDPSGFAKAFPGARMEVIDRKTGRRGDVDVMDAGRVGDFGAHLFTGRTVSREKGKVKSEKSYSSALGRAQEKVAQEKWGGGVVTQGNTTAYESASAPMDAPTGKESELVKGLRAADAIRKRDEEQMPIDYTKPGAVKQMVGGARRAQKSLERRMEQAGQEAGRNAEGEIRRRNAPAFDLGNENVNNNLVKTRGQLEKEMEESSRQLVDKQLGGYINNSIQKMFKDATVKGVAAEDVLSKASPFAYMVAGKAYNEALDPDKLMNQLSKNAEKDMAGLFSAPKMQKEIVEKAASFGIDPEDYVKNYIAPGLQAKIAEEFEKSELSRNMPKSTAEYIIRGVNDSMIGTILSMGMMSKKQRQYAQQGMAMTDNGENPYVKPGMGARVARGTLSFVADAPAFGAAGKAGAAVAGKAFGNGVAQAARIANTSLAGRIGRMVGTGAVSQGVTGVLYGSTNAAVQNYSTGDDTSIGNTVKLMTMGGLSEGASWATMGGIGGAVGAGIYNVSGVKRIPAKVFQIAMEGWGMHVGGNVAKMIEGHDTDFWSVEGTLEACANVVALKLTHARLPKRQVNDGKKEGYLDMVARNIKNLMTSDGQRAAFGGYVFTNEEKEQLFGSDKAPKREEALYGYDVHGNPLTRKESLTSWAMRAKKTAAKGKGEESYKDTDTEFVKTAYDEIMADETIPWDTKAKFSALVMGTVPSARPMMDHIAIERDERGAYVGEYSLYGELLSKNRYKTADEYVSIKYNLGAKKENQRLSNAYGAAQIKDEKAAQETLETVAETFGFTAEQLKAAMDKDPLKRSEEEQNACVALRKAYEGEQFPEGTLHPDQSQTEGKDVVEENNLGTENPNNEAVAEVLNNMNNAEKAFNAALESNDVLKQEYERLTKEGLSEPQIYMELFNSGLTQEQLAPFADYINAKAKTSGMYNGTMPKIAETVQKHVEQWSYKGELNGEKQDGGQMLFVKDNNGRVLIVGAGDVAFDNEGRARESVGDMLSVLDPNTKEMDFVSKKDVQLDHVEKTEDYAKNYQEMLEVKNSVAYAESEKVKEKSEKSEGESEELRVKSEESNGNVGNESSEAHSYTLSEKKAGNGEPFYQDESGNIDLATIPDEVFEGIGYTKAPFRLTPSMIKHMLDRHNKELGFKDEGEAINFVVDVMNNFDHVRLGYDGALVFSIENGRKRTGKRAVTVLINSDNGEFYGLKTSGYEGIKGLEKRPLLWERGANETSSTDAASASVTTSKGPISGGQSGSASHQGNGLHDKDSNNSPNGNGNKETLTFADGTPVPMTKDSKGRETADYSMMTPEQGAEWIEKTFGGDAEAVADGKIERAKKDLSKAEKMDIDMTADDADVLEAKAKKKAAIEAAQKELELYTNIKKAMVEKKVKATMEAEVKPSEGDMSLSKPREKFESGTHIVGNKRTRTLPDGSKIKGHYELVEADSLTPSHNANDGYKKSEGFPVNEEGRTINDRDYENDKDAQRVTDMIAMKYDGQAVDQVPVVTKDGIVVDGNGRTMAGQKAAKDGTDGAYLEALKENAENYGFTAEQIEQSGMKHPRLVLVSDEPLPYDTATFAKFNKNEKKTQGNTQQTVAISKKLGADEISAIAAEIEGSGSLDAFFNNPTAINSLLKRLIDKGVIGLNEVAGLREGEDKLSASGKDFVKNLLLGSVFSEDTIRMMGADAMLKTKALNGIRAVLDNMKLGDYALRDEIDKAVQLVYEARQQGGDVDAYLRTPAMFGENAADRYDPISQAIALALEGKAEDFRELMMAYNRNAAPYADASQTEMFGEKPSKEEFKNEFLKLRNWKDYETRHSNKEGNGDAGSSEGTEPQARGGNEPTEGQREVDKAIKRIATEITKKTGIEVVTDEKEAEEVIRESEETDSDLKYHKETDEATLEELENGETVKVYRAMQVIDGKLYPPMAAAVNGKRVEANELGVWIRADENPDLAIPDIDPKTKEQKVDKKTGELKWKFKLDKGGKDATGKKATDIPAAYNPYWHTSRSPLNDQFKSAWIRPNIVVVECEVPVSELSSGYRAERAKDAVGEVDWKSGVVSGEVYKQTGRARKVILSRWCKPVRVLSDAEVAQRAKEFVGDAKVEIPENVLTPRQRIEFEKAGFKIGAPEKGVKKSDQINEALKRGLQIDNSVKEFRTAKGEVYGFTDGEKIYLDTRKMKPETPLHEYAHLWCDMLRRVNPKEWESVKKLFDKVEGLKEEVQKLYPELEGDALYEEMITTYSGREGTKKLEDVVRKLAAEEGKSVTESAKAQGFLEKVKEALTKYWKGVADVLGIHFTTAEEVADKVLADWAKGKNPLESEEGRVKSEESDSVVTPKGDKKGDIKDATAPRGEKTKEEPSKTNPLAWLAHTAEMYKDEQVQKAKEELAKAKESGDASDIKRATADMKQAMETKLRGNGIGLVERRRIIGREIGKILGEEAGKAEAEKIDKPWEQMDLEEREAVSSKNPLTETEINELTSEENRELIPAALAYLRGDKGNIINAISYFKIWNDVRSRHENVSDISGTKDGTQLDAPNTGGSQELGLGRGREGGGPDGPVDRTDSERTTPGERESGTGGENDTPVPAGKPSNDKGEGNTPGMDAVPAGSPDTRGGGRLGNEGNVPKQGGQGGDNRPLDQNAGRKPTAKQGTHFPDSTSERLKQERAEYEQKKKDFWERWKKAGQGYMKIALTPFKALNLSPEQIEMLPELFKMHLNGAVLKIKEGIYKFNEWKAAMRAEEGEELKMIGLSDEDIDRFIEDYWNTPYEMDGETHTIGEWADIHGNEKLRNKLTEPLNEKYQRQVDAEPIKVKIGDKKNIEETLPYLLPQQQEDVLRAETQFFGNEHADREHAYGKGYMFTNGTGTGKTFTGLGIAKRLVKHGKGRILIVTPSQKKVSDWIKDGHNLNMEIRDLDSIAKERGTTATTENGEGVVITTFANFGVNKKLLEEKWDAVIYDESHRIMENKNGAETARSMQHYMVTNRSENHCFLRLQEINKDYQKVKSLGEQYDAEREKEMERIRKEYKASHPSATKRDVDYATSRMVPKERAFFAPGDYASFPKLGKIHAEFVKALSHYTNEVKPKLEAQAKAEWKDTKTIFLSATPFNTRENLDYVEGYIFKYPKVENSGRMSGRTQFYLDHFGAGYKFRFNRLEQSTSNPEAVAKQEIAFSDYLQHTLGTMSGRIIDSPYDYSRDFPTVSPDHAERFNQAVQEALTSNSVLAEAYRKTIGDYNYGSALFETMKVANIIERIKAHLDAGRKVVIFHRRVDTKEPIKPPFAFMLEKANRLITIMNEGNDKKNEAIQAVRDFRKKYADLLKWEQTLDYSMPREQIAKVFGKDKVLFFSGKESSKVKDKAVDTFNDDNSGKNIIVIQEASGKEGISLHDKTGEHQRVCITLALPQSPITALQIEGRTYRIGNKSNAIFEYPILGLNSEMMLFGQKFNNQVSTTENLALGSQARSLRDSFANGILEHSGVVPIDQQGVGGKEFDAPKEQDNDPFDSAVLDYYSNQKLNSRNREGVDYFPTPEPLGYKMMEWANMGEGDTVMEPSAGHGAIARYAPKGNQMVAIEPSQSLFAKLQLKAGGLGRKFVNTIFENYDISNKHDVVVMNPPFGTAGATAIAHLGKAFKHLEEGGRVVALIPRGSTDKKFEKWINGEKTAVMRAEVELPDIVFKQAGTNVVCRVVVVDKISNEAMRAKAGSVEKVNLGGHYDKIEDFFEDLRDIEMPDRIIDTNTIMQKKSKQTAKDLKELKDVTVNLNEHGINVHVRGDRNDYSIMFDLGEYNAEQRKSILSGTYERFEEYERYTRDETSQAVIAELKKLTCKLAGMTEEEMQRYLKKQNDGKGVMYRMEHAAEVYGKANAHYRMELGNTFSDSKEHFDAVRDRAVEEKGIVMPNLNKEKVKVVEVEKHSFKGENEGAIENARAWAKENLVTTNKQELPTMRDGTPYTISKKAVDKYLSSSAVSKSDELGIHLSVLPKLTDVIHESIEAEIHADYNVKDETGKRKAELGYGNNILVHRLYGAVEMDGKIYRVKTTMQEFRGGEENKPHSYEVTKIELLDSPGKRENPDRPPLVSSNNSIDRKIELPDTPGTAVLPDSSPLDMTPSNSKNITSEGSEKANESDSLPLNSATNGYISTAKLLQGVEKSYDSGKKLLDESKDLTDGETFFRKEGDGVVTPEKTSNAVSERIIKTVEKVAKRTGGKVKMVNSVEEIENPKVRKDIENGKQVTGWYDEKTGEVHLYMPNIHDTYTAEKTVWHETVGHKGMRGLLGDKFNDYMRSLWMDLDNPINAELRAYVKEKMNMNHLGFYDAIEEFIAKSAEDGKGEPGFWNYIKNKVTDALHEIGYRVSPNVKDVKYMLWLAKNVQKHGDSPLWKMRAEAVRWKIEHEKTEYTKIEGGELYDNDGKSHDFESMSREEWLEATDGEIHYRTSPSAATALDRYHHALDRHSYMATEAFMDNMLSLKKLMEAIDPSIRKIEDVASSMNPYLMQNITEGKMSDKSKLFEIRYMDPLSKAMSSVLDSFDGKKVEDRIRNFNLYMIRKHGLERNRVLFVRDKIREERKVKSEESNSIDALESAWKGEKYDLRKKLESGQIDLKEYYRQMDEWIVTNLDKDFKAEEHDYSGMHGLQGIADKKAPYDDAGAIDEVMSQEASMESMKKGSVADFWKKVKAATDYSVNSDYESGLISQITHDGVLGMFDWYVPLRKFDEATAEDVYGYVTEMGDPSNYIGTTLMNAKGRKSLSNVEILAQIGLMGNRAIRNGGQNMIKQAFARFVRNSGEQNLVKETKVWVEKTGTDLNGNDIWEEAYPQIPEGASADDVASIVDAFETDMRTKQAKGEAKSLSNGTDIGFKFQRAKDKSQHFVDVKIAGRTHRFVVLGNPRAAQALNGMLENGKASVRSLQAVTRWMAMASTSWSPEFVMRNIVRDMEFASSHVAAKEGGRYLAKWSRYYGELNPLNMFYNEGAGSLKSMKMKDFKNGVGFGLYARYREGTLGNSKMERYFKEFMENGGETGFVQLFSMHDMEKSYKSIVEKESAKGAKKVMVNAMEVLKILGKNVENLNEVAENMARFATYCTSRDLGRSAARSAYDAKEVSTNFNRHGSGDAIKSFKNGEMGDWQKARRNTYGFVAGYLRNYSMFFNAGIQSTNLLFKNIKRAPVGTTVAMTSAPFALALIIAAVNNAIIQNEDDKDRGNVKDPYGELPDYIRRNNLCIYVGNNKFVTVPLAIELRAFYSLGDLAAGQTFAKNVKSQRNMAMDAVGCMSQLFPVMDFLNNPNYEKSLENGVGMTTEGIAPTAIVPFIEWWLNNDWKGAPIRRTGDKTELNPAWQNAYNNVPARLVDLNKWVNAKTNNIAPGNPEMKGNEVLDWATDPSMLNHFFGSWSGGMGTFTQRTAGLGAKATTGKTDEIEVGDVPFLRSLFYTPREQSSMARTKAKWYNYKEEMEQTIANNDKLKSKNVPTMKRIENAAALEKFEGSPEQRKVNIIKNAEKRMRHWNTMRKKWADDKKQVDFANKNIEMIMQKAVEDLDRIE